MGRAAGRICRGHHRRRTIDRNDGGDEGLQAPQDRNGQLPKLLGGQDGGAGVCTAQPCSWPNPWLRNRGRT
eukprot:10518322-Alexandrium_andersonii.AAC.1